MRVLVTGIGGQLGYDVLVVGETMTRAGQFAPRGLRQSQSAAGESAQSGRIEPVHLAEPIEVFGVGRAQLDLSRPDVVRAVVLYWRPDVIVHAAAFTKVDLAEGDGRLEAYEVNAFGARALARAAAEVGAEMLYVSTDYVFDGTKGDAYCEWDQAAPVNEYGRSKWAGEEFVRRTLERHWIVRTSWVYGENTGVSGGNFVKTMLRAARGQLAEEGPAAAKEGGRTAVTESGHRRAELRVVADQVGCPTWSRDLAEGIWMLVLASRGAWQPTAGDGPKDDGADGGGGADLRVEDAGNGRVSGDGSRDLYGTYHMAGGGSCSWHDLAVATFAAAGLGERVTVHPVTTAEFPRPARRPAHSVLEPLACAAQGLPVLRPWREAVDEFVRGNGAE